ncbi:uncharacterized protein MELLADRAFT_61546 [Melampsora larici-populina 98AG31]|uniref:Uncharacterized protein n=1 Tax=Melampsora larici-populina (strain 98AG31 / pathotype 3-4-7) TaxID=747676 RepID=F4RFC6_MELLP|nr:uncharacterized protein MELLADRAFT_61546 [Melampsora larici-populina 98AG31]EGG08960.1 hypothetical protein MELLADRAFT_61546 [Melampsora larici-populina 98AG31]
MSWNVHMLGLLRETAPYSSSTSEFNNSLARDWDRLIEKCQREWEVNVNARSLQAEALDDQEMLEHRMLMWGEEEEELRLPRDEVEVFEADEFGFEVEEPDGGGDDPFADDL